ncbi:MAG: hypothetical protein PHW04_04970 [Candidatus Wallbacteria bacterium]|nr:hypothetical protein [Candidatus Wallbacteria bacterium]
MIKTIFFLIMLLVSRSGLYAAQTGELESGWIENTPPGMDFSLKTPPDWLSHTEQPGSAFQVLAPKEDTLESMPRKFSVRTERVPVGMTLNEYLTDSESEIRQFTGYRLLSTQEIKISDQTGVCMLFMYNLGSLTLEVNTWITLRDRRAYVVTATAEEWRFARALPLFRRIFLTFKFTRVQESGRSGSMEVDAYRDGRYYNYRYGFSLEPPTGWARPPKFMGFIFSAVAPPDGAMDALQENMNLNCETTGEVSLERYSERTYSGIRNLLSDVEIIDSGEISAGGLKARFMVLKYLMGKLEIQAMQFFLLHEGKAVLATYASEPKAFGKYRAVFEKSFSTFRTEETRVFNHSNEIRISGYYENYDLGFSVSYPPDWELNQGVMGTQIMVVSQPAGDNDTFREYFNLILEEIPAGISEAEFLKNENRNLQAMLQKFTVYSRGEDNIFGYPSHWMVATYRMGVVEIEALIIRIVKDNKVFSFTFCSEPSSFETYFPIFKDIAGKIRIF